MLQKTLIIVALELHCSTRLQLTYLPNPGSITVFGRKPRDPQRQHLLHLLLDGLGRRMEGPASFIKAGPESFLNFLSSIEDVRLVRPARVLLLVKRRVQHQLDVSGRKPRDPQRQHVLLLVFDAE